MTLKRMRSSKSAPFKPVKIKSKEIIMPGKMKDKDMKGKKPMPMKKGGKKK